MKILRKAKLPSGFLANGIHCGLKKSGKPDIALFYSQDPAKASCCFTTNTMQAAPIAVCKEHLRKAGVFRAVIANSGNANCFTGAAGRDDAKRMASVTAGVLDVPCEQVLVASTGVIGKRLAVQKIIGCMDKLVAGLSFQGIDAAKKAILTTDKFTKEASVAVTIGGKKIIICGVAKGAGMIAPTMATMLSFLMTDANIAQAALDRALHTAVKDSFNCITVDGCMSTNDSVMLLANGKAGNAIIKGGEDLGIFTRAVSGICLILAQDMVRDGEGATKLITIQIEGASNPAQAKLAALSIANSNLFKTAIYGQNPNFGRIVAAVGAVGIPIHERCFKTKVSSLEKRDVTVRVSLGLGKAKAVVYTSDLTPEYIKINAAYN